MRAKLLLLLMTIAGFYFLRVAHAEESDPGYGIAEAIIKTATVKCLADRNFEVAADPFLGTVHSVEPQKRIKVEIEDLQLDDERVLAAYTIAGRFHFTGRMMRDKQQHDLKCTADISVRVRLTATYRNDKGSFVVDARIIDLDQFEMKVVKLSPEDLPGGKDELTKLTNRALDDNMETLIAAVENWLAEHNRY